MPTIQCENCLKQIPDDSKLCPYCGWFVRAQLPKKTANKFLGGVLLVICGFVFYGLFFYGNPFQFSIFWIVDGVCAALPLGYIIFVGVSARRYQVVKPDEPSRTNYLDALKTLISAAGVTVAILASQKFSAPSEATWILRRAAECLTFSVVLSVATMFEMSRRYEVARANTRSIYWTELISVLVLGYFALLTFLLGFTSLAQLLLRTVKAGAASM